MTTSRERAGEAVGRVLVQLQERREALGLVELSEPDAQLRMRALDRLTADQFVHLLGLEPDGRAGMIAALVAAQRRTHELDLGWASTSSLDGRLLYRWACACGDRSPGDFFAAEAARGDWRRHAGIPEGRPGPGDQPGRRGTGDGSSPRPSGRPAGALRARRVLESTE